MIATQAKLGSIGEKPTTELSLAFDSLVGGGGYAFGLNEDGIHLLNSGDTDTGVAFTRSFTLATSDLGAKNPKRGRYFYIGYEVYQESDPMTIALKLDGQEWRTYNVKNKKVGLQVVRVPIGRDGKGRYTTIKISSTAAFRIDSIRMALYVLSSGNKGY